MTKKANAQKQSAEDITGMIRVDNATAKCIDIPPAVSSDGEGFPSRTLIPGGNDVPIRHLQALMEAKHEGFLWYVERGWIVPRATGEGTRQGPMPPASLDGYKPEAAVLLASEEIDPEVLRRWLSNEAREPVQVALTARLAALQGA